VADAPAERSEVMTTIQQLKDMPVGQKCGGFDTFIKTYKKTWQSGKIWFHQIIIMDETGEMPADVKIGLKYNTLRGGGNKIHVTVGEVQEAEYLGKDRKKLYIDQYEIPTITTTEYFRELDEDEQKWDATNRGKVRHWLVCSCIQAGKEINKPEIEELIEYIMTGKI